MATKKSATSKTAHVLNIISGDAQMAESEELVERRPAPAAAEPTITETLAPEAPAAAQRRVSPPILENAKAADDLLADQIRAAMEEELIASTAPERESTSEPGPSAASTSTPISAVEAAPGPVLNSAVGTVPEPAAIAAVEAAPGTEPLKTPEPSPALTIISPTVIPISSKAASGDLVYVNVMQSLVDEKADRYIRMFELCTCERCVTDVKALALTNLPAKYVVMHKGEMIPMLTVYESRFSAAVIAQLIQACKLVMDFPRHERG